jgi:ATP-dependent DNA helicase DinG
MREARDGLEAGLRSRGLDLPVLMQGEGSRTELLERFRRLGNAVLVGSQSFWEGVDVRGPTLSLVVIDRLPFTPPDDPVLTARIERINAAGGNAFMDYQLPHAVIMLKQGAGRLIRDETDRGVLMICDPRLVGKGYGRRIWQSLPPMRRTRRIQDVAAFFEAEHVTAAGGA